MTCLPTVAVSPIRSIRASVVGVVFLLVLAGTVPAGDSRFSMPKLVDGGVDGPSGIAVADLDGDGDSDIASISDNEGLVSWYKNLGATFGARRGVATVFAPQSVAIADINGDGRLDIVAGAAHATFWYANLGGSPPAFDLHNLTSLSGPFQAPTLIEGEIHAADFNGDGHTDLLSIDRVEMAWHRNNGADPPVFTRLFLENNTGSNNNTAAAGDLDGDGDPEIVSLWSNGSKVVVHDNDGSGHSGFTRRQISVDPTWPCFPCEVRGAGVIFNPRTARLADVDADGDMDFITASFEGNGIHWWDNDGAQPPGFVPRLISIGVNNASGANAAVPADVDRDGDLDVLVPNIVTHSIEWFENDGSPAVGFWASHGVDDEVDSAVALEAVDLDDDGDTDVVAADVLGDRVVWYANKTVSVDVSAPLIAPLVSGQAGNDGWYQTNALVDWSVEDDESLISSSSGCDVSGITTDTPGVSFTCTATSLGGTASESITVRRDGTPPVITFDSAEPPPNGDGWNNTDVAVPFTVVDQLSGVDTVEPASPLLFTLEGIRTLSVSATDAAGNIRSASATVPIDKTAPVINANRVPAPNASGWNNTDITVDFSCTDSRSGLAAGSPPPDVIVSAEGAGQSVSGQCEDRAGNLSSVTTIVNLDRTAPTASALPDRQPDSAGLVQPPGDHHLVWSGRSLRHRPVQRSGHLLGTRRRRRRTDGCVHRSRRQRWRSGDGDCVRRDTTARHDQSTCWRRRLPAQSAGAGELLVQRRNVRCGVLRRRGTDWVEHRHDTAGHASVRSCGVRSRRKSRAGNTTYHGPVCVFRLPVSCRRRTGRQRRARRSDGPDTVAVERRLRRADLQSRVVRFADVVAGGLRCRPGNGGWR